MAEPRPNALQRLGLAVKAGFAALRGGPAAGPINWTQNGGIPVNWNWNWWQQGLNPIRGGESATVNACINAYAQTIAQLPGRHMRERTSGGADPVKTSALARILRFPNAYQTRSDFFVNAVTQLLQTGNAYAWAKRNDRQEVDSLHLMPSRGVEPYVDPDTGTIFYALSENWLAGQPTPPDYLVPARDVLHIRVRTRPGEPLQGISPISWAAMAIASNTAISSTAASFFNNASQPSGFLSTKEKLDAVQMAALRAAWENISSGVAAGSVPILGGGLEFQQMGITSQDAQLVEAFGMSVADIARAFGVPLPIIGETKDATLNNVENLIGLWLSQGLGFYVEHIETALDKFFGLPATEYVELDTDVLMRTAFKDRIEALGTAVEKGLYSPDEAALREGLPPSPDGAGKERRVQAQLVPLSAAGAATPSAPTPPATPAAVTEEAMGQIVLRVLEGLQPWMAECDKQLLDVRDRIIGSEEATVAYITQAVRDIRESQAALPPPAIPPEVDTRFSEITAALVALHDGQQDMRTMIEAAAPQLDEDEALALAVAQLRKAREAARDGA